jgi:nucleoid DNA-binding protein
MTKAEMIQAVQTQIMQTKDTCTKKDAECAVNSVFAVITEALASGDKVTVSGFGSFEVRDRNAKECKNPRTGETIQVPASKAPVFKASKNLKEAVNND